MNASSEVTPGTIVRVSVLNYLTGQQVEWEGKVVAVDRGFYTVADADGDSYVVPLSSIAPVEHP